MIEIRSEVSSEVLRIRTKFSKQFDGAVAEAKSMATNLQATFKAFFVADFGLVTR
jgi:hypothetical protein